jgi:small-conductance mechanosensitive channel
VIAVEWLTEAAPRLTRVGVIVVIAWIAALLAGKVIRRTVARIERSVPAQAETLDKDDARRRAVARANTVGHVGRSATRAVIFVIAALVALGEFDINLGPLLAGASVAGVAIGFGAQSLVRDVLAGFFVLIEDQYGVGDVIDTGVAVGTVEQVTLRATQIRDVSGTLWHVPNGSILRVGNKTQRWARAVVDVVVSHDADLRAAQRVLDQVAAGLAQDPNWGAVRLTGEPEVEGVNALRPDGITLRLVVDTEPKMQWKVERELRFRIKEAFDQEGIPLEVHH